LQPFQSTYIPVLAALVFLWGGVVCAQHQGHDHTEPYPFFQAVDHAEAAGELTPDESLLQKFYAGFRPELLRNEFKSASGQQPIKCMVPAMRQYSQMQDRLLPETVTEVEEMIRSGGGPTEFSYVSPSGHFEFHYDTTGSDAVPAQQNIQAAIEQNIPDYIYHAAFAADSSYRYQVKNFGFTDFARDTPYQVGFRNFGFYGTTTSSGSTTFITIHSNFNNFPPNTHPEGDQIGALYVTIAHEIKHAIQYAANRWRGSAGSFDWIEMDATLAEEVVFGDTNDYYNYIKKSFDSNEPNSSSIFGNPRKPTPGAYWHITWMLYFSELYGHEFWVDVWKNIRAEPLMLFADAVEQELELRGEKFATSHLKNHLWHLGSGQAFAVAKFGFREREFYPSSVIGSELITIPDSVSGSDLAPMAAEYIQALPNSSALGQPNISVQSGTPGVGVGVIGTFRDGTSRHLQSVDELSSSTEIQTSWGWDELTDLKIAVVNTSRDQSADYTLVLKSVIPEDDVLAQNYPNPFNPSTRIEFSLNDRKDVQIDVYDSIGRKITTLLNDTLNEGFHFVDFDGSGLASGVYFYRIRTDQTITTNKMVLLK